MVQIYFVVKLNEPSLMRVWEGTDADCLMVRLQDLICVSSGRLNSTFYRIKETGGVHAFLGFKGTIVLSLIMQDKLIAQFTPEKYLEVIEALKPDRYTTVDGETYEGECLHSLEEIKRCVLETSYLVKHCTCSKPIGQVKGCNRQQILLHIKLLKMIGIEDFVFHVGDFFRNGNRAMIARAKEYAYLIRSRAKTLMLYGMGSQRRLYEFSFADSYVTLNYLVQTLKGRKYDGCRGIKYSGGYRIEIVKHNFKEILKNIKNLNKQRKLVEGGVCIWVEEQEVRDLATQEVAEPGAVTEA